MDYMKLERCENVSEESDVSAELQKPMDLWS